MQKGSSVGWLFIWCGPICRINTSMQTSTKQSLNNISLLDDNAESHFMTRDHQSSEYLASEDASKHRDVQSQAGQMQFSTLESSIPNVNYTVQNSPSSIRLSFTSGSSIAQPDWHSDRVHGSPVSASCVTEDPNHLKSKLREIEHEMLGAEYVTVERLKNTYPDLLPPDPEKWRPVMGIPRGDLKQHLIACARAITENDLLAVKWLVPELKSMVSVSGEPFQRLGAYLLEGLIAKLSASGSSIYKALECKQPASPDLLSYMHILYEVCPYFKFGYLSANGAISEAIKDENMVHIIDFQIAQGSQWVTLIQALAERPGGPPHLRITGIDDPYNAHARGGGLHIVGRRLSRLAHSCNVPFEFHAVPISGCDVEIEHLDIRPGEQLAVNFAMELHHIPDESVSTRNHRDRILRMAKSLSPKVVTLVEQEANTNTAPFLARFLETLEYFTAVFESIDVTLPRENKERINVEQHCLARDIVNLIACEGAERVERYELFGKWKSRLTMAGFRPYPLSPLVNATIKTLLHSYSQCYQLEERAGVLYLGWMNKPLVVSSAWR